MSEFTKGEWQTVFFKGMNEQEMYVKVSGGACICKILDRPSAEKKANARLIASAPTLKQQRDDLLEACKTALEFTVQYDIQQAVVSGASLQLQDAIAAAEK